MHQRILFFFLGFWAILGQVIFFREALVILFGNEIAIGLFYAVWFAGIFFGAFAGASLSDRLRKPFSFLHTSLAAMMVLVVAGVVMLSLGRGMMAVPVGQLVPFSTMTVILLTAILPLSTAVGVAFPVACRTAGMSSAGARHSVGIVYVFEALGGLTAGLLHAFFLITRFEVFFAVFVLGGITTVLLLLIGICGGREGETKTPGVPVTTLLIVAVLIAIALISGMHRGFEGWTIGKRWNSFTGSLELVESADSRYQNIALARQEGQYDLYLNGHYTESFPDPYGNAVKAHLIMTQHPDPRRVLVIGSGMTGFLDQLLLHKPDRIDYIEIDGMLVSFLKKYISEGDRKAMDSPFVNVVQEDGRHYVKRLIREKSAEVYDLVILNLPEPSNALVNRFYTRDFFAEVSCVLSPSGVVVTGLPFSENYIREEVLEYGKSVYNSLAAVFREVAITPGSRAYFIASDSTGVITSNADTLASRYRQRRIESTHFSEFHYGMLLMPDRVDFVRDAIMGPELVPENTDTNPVTYFLGFMLWDRYSGGSLTPLLRAVEDVTPWRLVGLFIFVFIFRVSLSRLLKERRGRFRSFAALFSIFTTGAAGMSVTIVLMFSFQSAVGYLYGNVGALIALFMFGLATGGWLLRGRTLRLSEDDLMILLETVAFSFILLLSIGLPKIQGLYQLPASLVEAFYYLMMFLCGIYTGAEFPLTSSVYVSETGRLGRGAGVIDAMDHGGALLGAFITGILLLPVMGVAVTLGILAAIKAVGVLFWLYGRIGFRTRCRG